MLLFVTNLQTTLIYGFWKCLLLFLLQQQTLAHYELHFKGSVFIPRCSRCFSVSDSLLCDCSTLLRISFALIALVWNDFGSSSFLHQVVLLFSLPEFLSIKRFQHIIWNQNLKSCKYQLSITWGWQHENKKIIKKTFSFKISRNSLKENGCTLGNAFPSMCGSIIKRIEGFLIKLGALLEDWQHCFV